MYNFVENFGSVDRWIDNFILSYVRNKVFSFNLDILFVYQESIFGLDFVFFLGRNIAQDNFFQFKQKKMSNNKINNLDLTKIFSTF